jgi:hypothetical protein
MRKRRGKILKQPYQAGILGGMAKATMQANQMLLSSGEVIFYRSKMISEAMAGRMSWAEPEFSRMWQEKITACVESCNAYNRNIFNPDFYPGMDLAENVNGLLKMQVKAVNACIKPYHKKAGANARRLRGKSAAKK